MTERIARVIEAVTARGRLVLLVSSLTGLASLPFAVMLYANLRAQIEELLPRSAPSILALKNLHDRLGESMQLAVLVSGAPTEALYRYVERLAQESNGLPHPPRFVDYRTSELYEFFDARKALFIETADLEDIEQRVKARVAYEKRKARPFDLGLDDAEEDETPELDSLFEKLQARVPDLGRSPSGFHVSEDGKSCAIIFYSASSATGLEAALAFRDGIDDLARRTAAEMGLAATLELEYSGDLQQSIKEQHSLQADLLESSLLVVVFEVLLLFGFFRWWPSVVALGAPLALGAAVTFALGWFFVGSLNASSAFLASIIVGNGINPGIILLSRFLEERRRGLAPRPAMNTAVRGTLKATMVASAAAAIAYGALMITTFRGYRPFGFMGGIGMVLCWIAAFLVLPPLALWLEARHPLGDASRPAWVDRFFARLGRATLRHSRPIAAVSAAATLACLVSMASIAHDPFENDTRKLQSSWASEPGGYGEVGDRVDRILKRIQTPAVILAGSEEDARTLERRYRELMRDGPPDLLLGSVFTAHTLVPPEQERKIEILGRIRKLLTPARLAKLDEKTQDLVRAWLPPEDLKPYGVTALPEVVRRQVREKDGTEGKLVLLYPRHGSDTADGRFIRRFAREIRSVPLTPGAWAAGSYLIFADMIESIQHDGPIATVAAFVGVFLLSLALARGERGGFLVPLSLVVGVIWTCGLGAASGMRINFLNFIALPITFGIGVDYAVNVYGRYRLGAADRATLVAAVANSGAAVAVASATTIIGYSSLLLSRNGALYSFGVLSVIGELACLTTALVLLPVMIGWRIPRR